MKLIAGNSNPKLAQQISEILDTPLANTELNSFSDGETKIEINENMRGEDVFVIQSTSNPANQHLMEMLICIDAVRRSSAKRITAVMPYFGYSRQDSKPGPRTPITAKLIANLITRAGADRVLTIDLHAKQAQGFFDIPCDNLFAAPIFARDIKQNFDCKNVRIISPDVGGVVRARAIAKKIDSDLAIIDKRREKANTSEVVHVIGDVEGYDCIIIDDIADTAGTLCNGAKALIEKGAKSVNAYITHGVLSGPAIERINSTEELTGLIVTDSINYVNDVNCNKIRNVTISHLFARAIKRINNETSISALFD